MHRICRGYVDPLVARDKTWPRMHLRPQRKSPRPPLLWRGLARFARARQFLSFACRFLPLVRMIDVYWTNFT